MRTGLPVPARIAIQMWMVIPIGAFGIVAAPSTLSAQVTVSYPSGIYGQYRRDLSDYGSRALTLLEDIAKIDINATYCTSADRANVNAELEALGARQAQLTRDYTAFKQRIESSSETSSIMTAFNAAGDNPKQENFWANADREILTHPQSDLSFKLAQLKKSTVVDCNPKPVKKVVTAPPPKPKTTAPNPLAGLTRPTLIPRPPFPVAPKFCSLNERDTWVKANIAPLMDANAKITWALSAYTNAILDRPRANALAGNDEAQQALKAELDWGIKAHQELDVWFFELQRYRDRLVAVDCTTKTATGQKPLPLPQKTTTEPIPKTRDKDKVGMLGPWHWRAGVGVEHAYYPGFTATAGDQKNILASTGKQSTNGIGATLGLGYKNWEVEVGGHSNTLRYEQAYKPNSSLPTRTMGSLRGRFFDLCGGRRFRYRDIELHGLVGLTYAIDKLLLDQSYNNGPFARSSRTLNTWKTNFGVNVDVPLYKRLNMRAGSTYTTGGKSTDADLNYRLHVGVGYSGSFTPNR